MVFKIDLILVMTSEEWTCKEVACFVGAFGSGKG